MPWYVSAPAARRATVRGRRRPPGVGRAAELDARRRLRLRPGAGAGAGVGARPAGAVA